MLPAHLLLSCSAKARVEHLCKTLRQYCRYFSCHHAEWCVSTTYIVFYSSCWKAMRMWRREHALTACFIKLGQQATVNWCDVCSSITCNIPTLTFTTTDSTCLGLHLHSYLSNEQLSCDCIHAKAVTRKQCNNGICTVKSRAPLLALGAHVGCPGMARRVTSMQSDAVLQGIWHKTSTCALTSLQQLQKACLCCCAWFCPL